MPDFGAQLYKVLFKDLLPLLAKDEKVTAQGLHVFFQLLQWCQHLEPEASFIDLLEELNELAKRVDKLKNPLYNVLRTQYKVSELSLEKELFYCSSV